MKAAIWLQILDMAVCILFHANFLGKDMNPFVVLPPGMDKLDRLGSLALIRQPVYEKKKL